MVKFYRKKPKALRRRPIKRGQKKLKYNYRKVNKVGAVKKIVRKELAKQSEVKMQSWDWTLTPLSLQSTTGTLTNNYMILNPSSSTSGMGYTINRGTGSGQMVGDKIHLKRAELKYVISVAPTYNATTNPLPGKPAYLRLYFYRWKRQPLNDPQVTNICGNGVNANFLEIGTSDIGFGGLLEDMNQKINRDQYTYLGHRTFKVGNQIPANVPLGVGNPLYTFSNNDFKQSFFGTMNISKYFPKTMTRDDNGDWMDPYLIGLFQWVNADNTRATNVDARIICECHVDVEYTDN